MARTGPQHYPGASTTYWHQSRYGGSPMETNVVCLHTTEGRTLPAYGGGSSAPNLTAVPDLTAKRLLWYQHFDVDVSSRALRNLRGGVETNTLNVVQVELVGTCDPATHRKWGGSPHIYWPQAPDWALRDVARFLFWAHTQHGVPLTGPDRWLPYPSSYGSSGGQRMSFSQWNRFRGICGHQHVPENDHGDPGALPFPRLLQYARELAGGTASPAPATGGATYTVQRGDTLWEIAYRMLGAGARYREIAELNRLDDADELTPGQVLRLPVTTYTVQRGDTLWSIAAARLGDGQRHREIATLNKLRDSDEITPGQVLTIPPK